MRDLRQSLIRFLKSPIHQRLITGLSDLHRLIPGFHSTDIYISLFMVAVLSNIAKNKKVNKNVLFLMGCPCSGKTTVARLLAQRNNIYCLSGDERRFDFYKRADASKHKYMTMDNADF